MLLMVKAVKAFVALSCVFRFLRQSLQSLRDDPMNLRFRVGSVYSIRPRAMPSPIVAIRAVAQVNISNLDDESKLWGAGGGGSDFDDSPTLGRVSKAAEPVDQGAFSMNMPAELSHMS